jgi:hypothetical protein
LIFFLNFIRVGKRSHPDAGSGDDDDEISAPEGD